MNLQEKISIARDMEKLGRLIAEKKKEIARKDIRVVGFEKKKDEIDKIEEYEEKWEKLSLYLSEEKFDNEEFKAKMKELETKIRELGEKND